MINLIGQLVNREIGGLNNWSIGELVDWQINLEELKIGIR